MSQKTTSHEIDQEPKWVVEARWRQANRAWLRTSAAIAIRILHLLKEQGRSQKDLALAMGVSPQQVNKYVKGSENLTLETISKIETALGEPLIQVAMLIPETSSLLE